MKRVFLKLILSLILLLEKKCETKKVLFLNNMESCPEYPYLPIKLIRFKNRNYSKSNKTAEHMYTVKKEISGDLKGTASLIKCDISGAPDTCEYFVKDFVFSDFCAKLKEKKQGWSPTMETFKPKLECPIKPGNYSCVSPISEDSFRFFPVPTGVWKAKLEVRKGTELILCQNVEAKVMEVRRA